MKYLITPSLLNAYIYFLEASLDNASEEFLNTLNKVFKTNEAIENGIKYEHDLMNKIVIDEFTPLVENGIWQVKLTKELTIDNDTFVLYGIADVIKENLIMDIKRTSNYKYLKYKNSMQHRIYMYCSEIHNFKYLINENDTTYYIEEYQYTQNTESEIIACINDFMQTINNCEEFKTAFNINFISNY